MITIGITGTYRSGKGTVAEYLVEKYGFRHYSVSEFIKDWMETIGMAVDGRDALIRGGNELRRIYGGDVAVRSLLSQAEIAGSNSVIESVRNPEEATFIKSLANGYLVAVDADPVIRYKRARDIKGLKDNITLEAFIRQEESEMNSESASGQNIKKCIELADFNVINNETLNELHLQIEGFVAKIEMGGKERRY